MLRNAETSIQFSDVCCSTLDQWQHRVGATPAAALLAAGAVSRCRGRVRS